MSSRCRLHHTTAAILFHPEVDLGLLSFPRSATFGGGSQFVFLDTGSRIPTKLSLTAHESFELLDRTLKPFDTRTMPSGLITSSYLSSMASSLASNAAAGREWAAVLAYQMIRYPMRTSARTRLSLT